MVQRNLTYSTRSDEEAIKAAGLVLDFDEIARKGSMDRQEATLAKAHGVYSSRQKGQHMVRITNPGGIMTSAQVRGIAEIAARYACGRACYTTRQSVQLHKVKVTDVPSVLRALSRLGLSTFHGCGDNLRNVAACPWAQNCPYKRFDVLPFARETQATLNSYRDLDNLPRKFKISYSGCYGECGQPHINCVGIVALVRFTASGETEEGFRVLIGGGMGAKAMQAREVFSFVPKPSIHQICRAIGMLFRDHGDRYNRSTARLKFIVERLGVEGCREIILGNLVSEGIGVEDLEMSPVTDCGPPVPPRPMAQTAPESPNGGFIQRILVPKGELTSEQLTRVAELSEMYADKYVHSSNRQNLELHGVQQQNLSTLRAEVTKLGFPVQGFFGLRDIVPCVGTTFCPLAVSATRNLYDRILPLVSSDKYDCIWDKAIINITGCPNSCSPYRIADIGFRGMRIREHDGSVEAYQMLIGGTESNFGLLFGEYKEDDCVLALESILDSFLRLRRGEETLADNIRRVGVETYKEDFIARD